MCLILGHGPRRPHHLPQPENTLRLGLPFLGGCPLGWTGALPDIASTAEYSFPSQSHNSRLSCIAMGLDEGGATSHGADLERLSLQSVYSPDSPMAGTI